MGLVTASSPSATEFGVSAADPTLPLWMWVTSFAVAGSAPGWAGDSVWDFGTAGICVMAGMVGYVSIRAWCAGRSRWTAGALGAALRGVILGLFAWIFSLMAWLVLDIAVGGRVGWPVESLLGAITGALFGWFAAACARRRVGRWRERLRKALLMGAAGTIAILAVVFAMLTGPRQLSRYPEASSSPYRLPFRGGVRRLCVQGNCAVVSHRDWEEFAYDFAMPVGSDVCAARAGMVVQVDVTHEGNGPRAANNLITIRHADGTHAWYLHLQKDGGHVREGQNVRQGECIAASGNVGISMLPHLHFHVTGSKGHTLPVTFADVPFDAGIPRMFKRYTSGNMPEESDP